VASFDIDRPCAIINVVIYIFTAPAFVSCE
jgi:hypothetical protein